MKQIFYFYIIIISLLGNGLNAQVTTTEVSLNQISIILAEDYDQFKRSSKTESMDSLCSVVVSFVAFKLYRDGRITDIEVSSETPSILKKYIKTFLENSSGKHNWTLFINKKEGGYLPILVPFVFSLSNSFCKPQNLTFSSVANILDFSSSKTSDPQLPGGNNRNYFNGILLKPFIYISQGR